MEITFQPKEVLLEFESFEKWLRAIANDHMTIEDLCRRTFDELSLALGDIPLRVEIHAKTTVHSPVVAILERT